MSHQRQSVIAAYVRSPIGRFGGGLAQVRPDSLAAHVIQSLVQRTRIDPSVLDDIILGCANQAGEDNRNVARMAALVAGLPLEIPGQTVNRLCGSGLQAVNAAAHAIWSGQGEMFIAGGVESMTRAPIVMLKAECGFARGVPEMADTTLGWRFPHPRLVADGHTVALGQTAENVAARRNVSRQEQDEFALLSQQKAARAQSDGRLAEEIVAVPVPSKTEKGRENTPSLCSQDEHPRPDTTLAALAKLKPAFVANGTVTAGNASGINDGAAALLVTSAERAQALRLEPLARIVSTAVAGVQPDEMGLGPVPASRKALERAGLSIQQTDIVEINEAYASQAIACLRDLE
ncbi:MAG TPA: acetyl-CoA C-acyltransferase, partial [Gemmataceae bacterium]|nr:acetyl-CoA C-acyltransferase [Gemmataceae bacterium]